MRRLLLLLLLISPVWANTLTLEFAQEGDPGQPRALIVIHNSLESREAFKVFFERWAIGSWGRDQYCSVYCYEYEQNGVDSLASSQALALDLYEKIKADEVKDGRADVVNPARRTAPTDGRQPLPNLRADNLQLLFAGSGYGGLVARRACLLAKADEVDIKRAAYLGTPLDGLSTIDLVLGLTVPERATLLGLERPIPAPSVGGISEAWWSLTELFDPLGEWQKLFAPAYHEVPMAAAYGVVDLPPHPTDNVLFGRHRPKAYGNAESHDGFLPQPVAWGQTTGPITWLNQTVLVETPHHKLTEVGSDFLLKHALDRPVIFEFLARREAIELYVKGKVGEPPLYQYWDERDGEGFTPGWEDAYASRTGLYEMMWGVQP